MKRIILAATLAVASPLALAPAPAGAVTRPSVNIVASN